MAPTTRRPKDPMAAAEAVFRRQATPPLVANRGNSGPSVPTVRETVTLKIDSDVLEKFQSEGPGWQDRINAALRSAVAMDGSMETGTRPEDLDATNDD